MSTSPSLAEMGALARFARGPLLAIAATAVALVPVGGASGSIAPLPPVLANVVAPPTTVKPVVTGLVDRSGPPDPAWRGVVSAYVVNTTWAELQPNPVATLSPGNAIDAAIAEVRRLNQASPATPLRLKLRVLAGDSAPEWAKQLDGPAVPVQDDVSGRRGTIGRFWTDRYGEAYAQLQRLLAGRYDRVPELVDVTIGRCTTFYAEPFIRQASTPVTGAALVAAGYTAAADARCLTAQIDAHSAWQLTRSSLALNPWQRVQPDGSVKIDEAYTETMMTECVSRLGPRCVLENNSIRWEPLAGAYDAMYQAMQRNGAPIAFQTATSERIGDPLRTLDWAVAHGAGAVELNRDYPTYPLAALVTASIGLTANARP